MSWLAPLYLLGAFAIAAPIVFHLWRRSPQGHRAFSTLMFLQPSPPTMTRLSNIEHWSLLLLRAAALLLLALAFSRPVWRIPATVPIVPDETELIAILIDTSASMRREPLWSDAIAKVTARIDELPATAIVAVYGYDDDWSPLLSFEEALELPVGTRRQILKERLGQAGPTWGGTNLGRGLVRTAQAVQEAQSGRVVPQPQRIWLVSDLQTGSDLSELRAYDWPAEMPVEWVAVAPKSLENAGLQLVAASEGSADDQLRIRVSNAAGSTRQQWHLAWGDEASTPCLDLTVPPGQSRVVSLPPPPTPAAGRTIVLTGDNQPFDNRLSLPTRQPKPCTVLYVGRESIDDPESPRFYLERAFASNARYQITFVTGNEQNLKGPRPSLVVATTGPGETASLVGQLTADGVPMLLVPRTSEDANALFVLADHPGMTTEEAKVAEYALWSEIDFESPWFAPFREAQFSDFSGIHFWKYRKLKGELPSAAQVLVRFDDQSPAIVQFPGSKPRMWWFASGWHPADSQLSRSSKFVPLMWRILESALGDTPAATAQRVGEPLRRFNDSTDVLTVTGPNGTVLDWPADEVTWTKTDLPGNYLVRSPTDERSVSVNLAPDESRTDPMGPEQLEAHGVRFSTKSARPALPPSELQLRQQQLAELEQRQQFWRWILLGAALFLMLETILGSVWRNRRAAETA